METSLSVVLAEKAQLLADRGDTLYTVTPEAPASEAIRVMCEGNVGSVLVVNGSTLMGIFSERDVLRRIAHQGVRASEVPVRELMTSELFTVEPGMTVEEALVECTDRRIRHLPVVQNGKLLGLLSIGDLVRFVVQDKDRDIADLVNYIHGQQIEV